MIVKKTFISHPYSDNPELRLKQVDYICRNLSPDILPISPLHLFSFEDDDSRREQILQVCFDLIDMCDEAWFYKHGNSRFLFKNLSEGQKSELRYALSQKKNIRLVKLPEHCIKMEKQNEKYKENIETLKKMTTDYQLQRELMEPVNEGWI